MAARTLAARNGSRRAADGGDAEDDAPTRATRLTPSTRRSSADEAESEYEVLFPSAASTRDILRSSAFYARAMPESDALSDALLGLSGSLLVRAGPMLARALIERFTDARLNWRKKTLQSFLELVCWLSVSCAAYSLSGDALFAVEVGTFVGAVMSICDEVVLQLARGVARVIRNQQGGRDLLERLGFDVPTNGKAPTDGKEVVLIKNLVFGYLGVVAVRSLWTHMHDVTHFAALTACTGVAFVVTAEFFSLWLPTRRVGLTLQSRFTKVRENWREHQVRSLVEVLCWTLSTALFYQSSRNFLSSLQLGTLVAVAVSLTSGLEELPDFVSSDDPKSQRGEYSYWAEHASGDMFMVLAEAIVKLEKAVAAAYKVVEDEAMNMYENFGE